MTRVGSQRHKKKSQPGQHCWYSLDCGLHDWGNVVRLHKVPVPAPAPNHPLIAGTRCSFRRGKAVGTESDQALPSSSKNKNKNVSGYTSTPPRLAGLYRDSLLSQSQLTPRHSINDNTQSFKFINVRVELWLTGLLQSAHHSYLFCLCSLHVKD